MLPLGGVQLDSNNRCTGGFFIDTDSLEVCHVKRSSSYKVFKGLAASLRNLTIKAVTEKRRGSLQKAKRNE